MTNPKGINDSGVHDWDPEDEHDFPEDIIFDDDEEDDLFLDDSEG